MKLTKDDLRKVYRAWAREEAEAIDVIEAVAKYLGEAGRAALAEEEGKE